MPAKGPAALSRITVDQHDNDIRLRLGREPIARPKPLAELDRRVVATRRGKAVGGDQGTSPRLFPGARLPLQTTPITCSSGTTRSWQTPSSSVARAQVELLGRDQSPILLRSRAAKSSFNAWSGMLRGAGLGSFG